MACFSRGLLLPGLRSVASSSAAGAAAARSHNVFLGDLAAASSRCRFSTVPCRLRRPNHALNESVASRATKQQQQQLARTKPSPPSPQNKRAAVPGGAKIDPDTQQTRYAFMKGIIDKPTPTTLYEGPSHFWFYFGCWSSGISLLTWSVLTGPHAMEQPEDVPKWVGYTFGASYALLCGMGLFLIRKTPNIIKTIRLLPGRKIELTVKRMVPMLAKPKVVIADLDSVRLGSRFSIPDEFMPKVRAATARMAEEERLRAERRFDMQHILTMPFRHMGRAFVGLFQGVRAAWTDMGMGLIKVDGKRYKLDITRGFAHDGFRTLEKIVEIDP